MVEQPITERNEKRRLRYVIQAITFMNRYTNEIYYQVRLGELTYDQWSNLLDMIKWGNTYLFNNEVITGNTHRDLSKAIRKIERGDDIKNIDLMDEGVSDLYNTYDRNVVPEVTQWLFSIDFKEHPFNVPDFTLDNGILYAFHRERGWEEPSVELLDQPFVETYIKKYYGRDVYEDAYERGWTEGELYRPQDWI